MSTKQIGLALMVLGGVLAIVGLAGLVLGGGSDDDAPAAASTTTAVPADSTTTAQATTTAPTTQASTTATQATTTTTEATTTTTQATTTTQPTTTTTLAAEDRILMFLARFVEWIAADDVDSLMASLHPAVTDRFGEDLCRPFVEREILELVDYQATDDVAGPSQAGFGEVTVEVYIVPVSFTFQGQSFDNDAAFGFVDDEVRWFTTCR